MRETGYCSAGQKLCKHPLMELCKLHSCTECNGTVHQLCYGNPVEDPHQEVRLCLFCHSKASTASTTMSSISTSTNAGSKAVSSISSSTSTIAGINDESAATIAKVSNVVLIKKREEWAGQQKMKDVKFNNAVTEIISIGGQPLNRFIGKMFIRFCRGNCITVPNGQNKKKDCINLIINHHKGTSFRAKVGKVSSAKRSPASTRPLAVQLDGTLFRTILAITHSDNRAVYLKTCDKLNRKELDEKNGHKDEWKAIWEMYSDADNEEMATLGRGEDSLIAYAALDDESKDFDKLTVEEFADTVKYINFHYDKTRKDKNKSGNHLSFEAFAKLGWIVFYHHRLAESGDKDLLNAAYVELPPDVFNASSALVRHVEPLSQRTTFNAGSPTLSLGSQNSQKSNKLQRHEEMGAKKIAAMEATTSKNNDISKIAMYELQTAQMKRIDELSEQEHKLEKELKNVRNELKRKKQKMESTEDLADEKAFLKRSLLRAKNNLKNLKRQMNYEDPVQESSSESE